ncbi:MULTISPECIES: hypothetical protein [Asticcacaulis]|uniref:hypothetical protein n=1 Tax=Asticcacaulis TaxID=76890 RepID=UPI001AE9C74F|nr:MULTISPECIES: hypothetical protein [Asticcacaulis]MBP2160018.1 hypothetical protein [Asticcacaulis solisilvae]MDR6801063.1 hypothetical protein [Asticcacaulis sp. BE141]
MGEFVQFFWAIVDSTSAALIGLNLVPVLVFSLFIGFALPRGRSWLKAPFAVIPAMLVVAVWPAIYGAEPIWPDLMQMETEIQTVVLLAVAWAIIWLCEKIKALFMPVNLSRPLIPVIIASKS